MRLQPRFVQFNPQQLPTLMLETIINHETVIDFYQRLLNYAPNDFQKEYLQHMLADDVELLNRTTSVYNNLYGPVPAHDINKIAFSSYKEGLHLALNEKLQTLKTDRNTYISLADETQTQYQEALDNYRYNVCTDMEHLSLIGTLYNQI